jgi:glutamate-1-semialdehyde 2,1-aminomutase
MMFSVDGVGDLYEYIRFPGVWEQTKQNILEISKMKNVKPLVYTVVQNLNIAHLGDIIKWCVEQNIYHMCDMLHQPGYLQITNLPDLTRFETISNLGELVNQGYPSHIDELIQNCIVTLAVSEHDKVLWSEFVAYISQRDSIRGNNHQKFIKYE